MRDIVIGLVLLYFTLRSFGDPVTGILTWTVISLANPHKLAWRIDTMPVAAAVAIATLVGVLVSRERKRFPLTRESLLLLALMGWFTVTWLASGQIEPNYPLWKKVMKIDFMLLVAMLVLHKREHVMALAWAVAGSLAFYGVKGGVFTIAHGGTYRVWGPTGSYIEGNNELALALIVTIPLLRFLQLQVHRPWLKHGLTAAMLLSAVSALGSQSRGALVAIIAMGAVLWWRGHRKFAGAIAIAAVAVGLLAFMPESWHQRMDTITSYEDDASALGRINAWQMCWNLAKDNFFGGSFAIYNAEVFARYAPDPTDIHAAHSIYFQILGEHGFVGLLLYLMMWWFTWMSAGWLRKHGRALPQTRWASDLGSMCQVSMAGFFVGGAFLSLAYFDLPYNILVLVVAARQWVVRRAWETEPAPAAAPASAPAAVAAGAPVPGRPQP